MRWSGCATGGAGAPSTSTAWRKHARVSPAEPHLWTSPERNSATGVSTRFSTAPSHLDQIPLVLEVARHRDRLGAGWDAEFREDRRDVMIDGLGRNKQTPGYGRVAQPVGHQPKNLRFAPGQAERI